jgi:hypothetical protein
MKAPSLTVVKIINIKQHHCNLLALSTGLHRFIELQNNVLSSALYGSRGSVNTFATNHTI